jgi:hypothetical protein
METSLPDNLTIRTNDGGRGKRKEEPVTIGLSQATHKRFIEA